MKVKTSELIGQALNWAVAKCEREAGYNIREGYGGTLLVVDSNDFGEPSAFSTDWAQAGPIIERERLCVGYKHQLDPEYVPLLDPANISWARTTAGGHLKYGPTPLIAAMRCYVASKLGDTVNIPEVV